jgi:hypothetical protein
MWEMIYHWFAAFFQFIRPRSADFEAVQKSMQTRMDQMDLEFKAAIGRSEMNLVLADRRIEILHDEIVSNRRFAAEEHAKNQVKIASLEEAEAKCRSRLTAALTEMSGLKRTVKLLMAEREESDRIRSLKEDQGYKERSVVHVTELIKEHDRQTKVEEDR